MELGGGGTACKGSDGKILLLLFVYCITVSVWFGQFSIVAVCIVMLTIVIFCLLYFV